jgi:hypothetical protein
MSIKTFKGQLVSSKLKKFVHDNQTNWKTGDEIKGSWEFTEDVEQSDRIGVVSEISYNQDKGTANKLHSLEGPSIESGKDKQYYLNGINYSKNDWTSLREIGKLDSYIDKSL